MHLLYKIVDFIDHNIFTNIYLYNNNWKKERSKRTKNLIEQKTKVIIFNCFKHEENNKNICLSLISSKKKIFF